VTSRVQQTLDRPGLERRSTALSEDWTDLAGAIGWRSRPRTTRAASGPATARAVSGPSPARTRPRPSRPRCRTRTRRSRSRRAGDASDSALSIRLASCTSCAVFARVRRVNCGRGACRNARLLSAALARTCWHGQAAGSGPAGPAARARCHFGPARRARRPRRSRRASPTRQDLRLMLSCRATWPRQRHGLDCDSRGRATRLPLASPSAGPTARCERYAIIGRQR